MQRMLDGRIARMTGTSSEFGLQLDSLADRLMFRLAYRNFGDHEALVVTHSVTPANALSGIRWYELRNAPGSTMAASTPVVFQQGTYAPDGTARWMGSAAMDAAGDLAVGYSEDPDSAPRGGDVGLVPVSQLMKAPPELRNAVLKKEPGAVNVASINGGYTIVLVVAHELPGQRDLATPGVKDQIHVKAAVTVEGDEVIVDSLFSDFSRWMGRTDERAAAIIKDLRRYADIYTGILNSSPTTPCSRAW